MRIPSGFILKATFLNIIPTRQQSKLTGSSLTFNKESELAYKGEALFECLRNFVSLVLLREQAVRVGGKGLFYHILKPTRSALELFNL